ncbi:unnamed protein product [Durusdinium trenchii]|uniref:Uncharacterized protein n=1 Tax=Durusdinium trenchii TaxID=1381693 RepID=A0ABP0L0E5_9DINO
MDRDDAAAPTGASASAAGRCVRVVLEEVVRDEASRDVVAALLWDPLAAVVDCVAGRGPAEVVVVAAPDDDALRLARQLAGECKAGRVSVVVVEALGDAFRGGESPQGCRTWRLPSGSVPARTFEDLQQLPLDGPFAAEIAEGEDVGQALARIRVAQLHENFAVWKQPRDDEACARELAQQGLLHSVAGHVNTLRLPQGWLEQSKIWLEGARLQGVPDPEHPFDAAKPRPVLLIAPVQRSKQLKALGEMLVSSSLGLCHAHSPHGVLISPSQQLRQTKQWTKFVSNKLRKTACRTRVVPADWVPVHDGLVEMAAYLYAIETLSEYRFALFVSLDLNVLFRATWRDLEPMALGVIMRDRARFMPEVQEMAGPLESRFSLSKKREMLTRDNLVRVTCPAVRGVLIAKGERLSEERLASQELSPGKVLTVAHVREALGQPERVRDVLWKATQAGTIQRAWDFLLLQALEHSELGLHHVPLYVTDLEDRTMVERGLFYSPELSRSVLDAGHSDIYWPLVEERMDRSVLIFGGKVSLPKPEQDMLDCTKQLHADGNLGFNAARTWNEAAHSRGFKKVISVLEILKGDIVGSGKRRQENQQQQSATPVILVMIGSCGDLNFIHTHLDPAGHSPLVDLQVVVMVDMELWEKMCSRHSSRGLQRLSKDFANVHVVPQEFSVHASWGGFSLLAMELIGYLWTLANFPAVSHIALVSANSIPLRTPKELTACLQPGVPVVDLRPTSHDRHSMRHWKHAFSDCGRGIIIRKKSRVLPDHAWVRKIVQGQVFKGDQWKVMDTGTLRRVFYGDLATTFQEYLAFYDFTLIPDESLLANFFAEHLPGIVPHTSMFREFLPNNPSPRTFNVHNHPFVKIRAQDPCFPMFGRKVKTPKDLKSILAQLFRPPTAAPTTSPTRHPTTASDGAFSTAPSPSQSDSDGDERQVHD